MNNLNELIELGQKIILNYEKNTDKNTIDNALLIWKKECVVSTKIILDYLCSEVIEAEKISFLAKLIGEYHEDAKPPAISYWCKKIINSIESSNKTGPGRSA